MLKKDYPFLKVEIGDSFSSGISTHVDWKPRTNVIETGDLLVVEVELPGVKKDGVNILLQGDKELIINGNKPKPRHDEPLVNYLLFEREFGTFYKKIVIDFPLDSSNISSSMENGVLVIKLPRKKNLTISVDIK